MKKTTTKKNKKKKTITSDPGPCSNVIANKRTCRAYNIPSPKFLGDILSV